MGRILLILSMVFLCGQSAPARCAVLDDFEDLHGWSLATSEGVHAEIAQDTGRRGMGMRIDFDFGAGLGYVIVHRRLSIPLPDNFAFTFYMRGQAPVNDFEFKLVDPSGQNVWWRRQRDAEFPGSWQRVVVRKRQLQFAWGPTGGGAPLQVGAIEFAIATGNGGKGSVWIDDLEFEERKAAYEYRRTPSVRASTSTQGHDPARVLDHDPKTSWRSGTVAESQWLLIDFLEEREYGGLVIDWDANDYASAYQVQVSDDGRQWTLVYTCAGCRGGRNYLYMPDAESRYVRLELQRSSRRKGYGIAEIAVQPYAFSASPNRFFEAIARDSRRGLYPKYFSGEQTYWTLVGADGGGKQGLLNEEGALEVDKGGFSIEPFLYANGSLITWNDVERVQGLEQGYLPIPSVTWARPEVTLKVTAFALGESGRSALYARYRVQNTGSAAQRLSLFLTIRPFQVLPPWQSLNMTGGTSRIRDLGYVNGRVRVDDKKTVIALAAADGFGAAAFDQGSVTDYLVRGELPAQTRVTDAFGYASGALEYRLDLPPGGAREVYLVIPFAPAAPGTPATDAAAGARGPAALDQAIRYWQDALGRVDIDLPPAAAKIAETLKSNLAYILINRDGPALRPGSRCYARSWIRDGALMSSALLGMGFTEPVRAFIKWYAQYQYPNGKIPCCVDRRGADAVAENDSNGEFIYAIMEYYRYTRDVGFLSEMWPYVLKAVGYLDFLRRQRLTPAYESADQRPYYGLLPESISHEGYSANPVHSYWDDFFALLGLKDAANMAVALGDGEHAKAFAGLRDEFRSDLYASIARTMTLHGIDFIPGSVELGDFDPNATTIAVDPGGELHNLPEPALQRTFEDYYQSFVHRRAGELQWNAYTPYELRIVGTFVRLGWRERAQEVLDYLLAGRRPPAWNQWPEVVWRDPRAPKFIGDLPHSWIGGDYIRAVRSMFVFEREADEALVIAAGVPSTWVESAGGVTVKRLPTYHGALSYSVRKEGDSALRLSLSGDVTMPPGKIVVPSPLPRPLQGLSVNGKASPDFTADEAVIDVFPAEVILHY